MRGINSHAVPVPLFLSTAFFTHFSFYEREREKKRNTTRNETKIKGARISSGDARTTERAVLLEKREETKKRKKENKKKIHMRGKCVIRVGRTTGITRSTRNNEPEIQRKRTSRV